MAAGPIGSTGSIPRPSGRTTSPAKQQSAPRASRGSRGQLRASPTRTRPATGTRRWRRATIGRRPRSRADVTHIGADGGYTPPARRRRQIMILGLSTHAFTVLHVVLSLVGIASGVVV